MGEPAIADIEEKRQNSQAAMSKEKSSIAFPYDDLDAAIEVVRAVLEQGGKCTNDQLAAKLKYSSIDNGAFRMRLGTARHFGLVTVSRAGISITVLGRQILDPATSAAAKAAAFLTVPLYKRTYDEHKGYALPPAAGLELKFVEYGVAAKQKDKARQAFQRSAETAGFFQHGKDRLVAPVVGELRDTAPDDSGRVDGSSDSLPPKDERKGGAGGHSGGGDDDLHPFIRGLVQTLPKPGSLWSDTERKQWLGAAESIFNLIYAPNNPALGPGTPVS